LRSIRIQRASPAVDSLLQQPDLSGQQRKPVLGDAGITLRHVEPGPQPVEPITGGLDRIQGDGFFRLSISPLSGRHDVRASTSRLPAIASHSRAQHAPRKPIDACGDTGQLCRKGVRLSWAESIPTTNDVVARDIPMLCRHRQRSDLVPTSPQRIDDECSIILADNPVDERWRALKAMSLPASAPNVVPMRRPGRATALQPGCVGRRWCRSTRVGTVVPRPRSCS